MKWQDGVIAVGFRVPMPTDYVWEDGKLLQFAACETPKVVVAPADGFRFVYDVVADAYRIVKE